MALSASFLQTTRRRPDRGATGGGPRMSQPQPRTGRGTTDTPAPDGAGCSEGRQGRMPGTPPGRSRHTVERGVGVAPIRSVPDERRRGVCGHGGRGYLRPCFRGRHESSAGQDEKANPTRPDVSLPQEESLLRILRSRRFLEFGTLLEARNAREERREDQVGNLFRRRTEHSLGCAA